MYDLLIIGGGPAGAAAGVYAARKRVHSVLVANEWGGQSTVSPDVQNWVGTPHISGVDIASSLKKHVETYAEDILDVVDGDAVVALNEIEGGFEAATKGGKTLQARTVLVCSGSSRRKLPVEGAERLDNRGISYCASCDAPLYKGKDVAVVGGGNAGFEAAQQLLDYATSVTLFERGDEFKADPVTVEKVLKNEKMKALTAVELTEVTGEQFVDGVSYKDKDGVQQKLAVGGVFVEIGSVPNSAFVKGLVELNKIGEIVVDHKTQRASRSMGDAVKALEDIYLYVQRHHR
jgi:NADH-dependent peroxiredoxin subunit F